MCEVATLGIKLTYASSFLMAYLLTNLGVLNQKPRKLPTFYPIRDDLTLRMLDTNNKTNL